MRDEVPNELTKGNGSSYNAIKQTLDKMNAKVESAKRKMEMHSVTLKRDSKEFNDDQSEAKPSF